MLKIEHLKKSYENFSLDCSLEVKKGHVTGLIGQNGAGKSTTFKAILGLISFDSGTINILGKSLQDFTAKDKQDLGVVLSDSGFSGYLTINDIIPIIDNLYQNFDKSFFIEQVKKFQLPRNKRIKDFSTGMKAKVKVLVAVYPPTAPGRLCITILDNSAAVQNSGQKAHFNKPLRDRY